MITGNEPINGIIVEGSTHSNDKYQGLTIRQHFAAMAMQGLCAMPETEGNETSVKQIARVSVQLADLLIAELNKQQQ